MIIQYFKLERRLSLLKGIALLHWPFIDTLINQLRRSIHTYFIDIDMYIVSELYSLTFSIRL